VCQTTKVHLPSAVYYVPLIMDSICQQIIDRCAKIMVTMRADSRISIICYIRSSALCSFRILYCGRILFVVGYYLWSDTICVGYFIVVGYF